MRSALVLVLSGCLSSGCVVARRPAVLPAGKGPAVLVGSASLPPPMNDLARHPWIAVRERGHWERWEVMCCPSGAEEGLGTVERSARGPLDDFGGSGGDVRVHGVFVGERAVRMTECIRQQAPRYPHRHRYTVWPGPNSNTFVDWLLRSCDIPIALPAPSVGKDYRGPVFGVSTTAGGTGLQMETPLVGFKLGATEGVEIHFFTLSLGLDWWPPALIVPFGPGRLGFDDR